MTGAWANKIYIFIFDDNFYKPYRHVFFFTVQNQIETEGNNMIRRGKEEERGQKNSQKPTQGSNLKIEKAKNHLRINVKLS